MSRSIVNMALGLMMLSCIFSQNHLLGKSDPSSHSSCCISIPGPQGSPGAPGSAPDVAYGYYAVDLVAGPITVIPGAPILFNTITSLNVSPSTFGVITIQETGSYRLDYTITAQPFFDSGSTAAIQVFVNSVPLPGSNYGVFIPQPSLDPEQQLNGQATAFLTSGQTIALVNVGGDPISLQSTPNVVTNPVVASLIVKKIN